MTGTFSRVFAVYPLATPLVFITLSMAFPGYFSFDQTSQRVNITFTLTELGAAFAGGYGIIGAVFWKWGIKK